MPLIYRISPAYKNKYQTEIMLNWNNTPNAFLVMLRLKS